MDKTHDVSLSAALRVPRVCTGFAESRLSHICSWDFNIICAWAGVGAAVAIGARVAAGR